MVNILMESTIQQVGFLIKTIQMSDARKDIF